MPAGGCSRTPRRCWPPPPPLGPRWAGCARQAGFEPTLGPEFTTDQDTLASIGYGPPSWTVFYAPHAEQLPVPGVVFRPLRNPTPVMRTYLAVRPEPPSAELRALLDAVHTM